MHVTITNPSTGRGAIERASAIFKDDAASWGLSAGPAVVLALLPVVVTGLVGASHLVKPIYRFLTAEDSLLEWTQVLAMAGVAVLLALTAATLASRREWVWVALFGLGAMAAIFIVGEEVSWGQRLLGITTPAALEEVNLQGETNLHNVRGVLLSLNFVSMVGAGVLTLLPLAAAAARSVGRNISPMAYRVVPPLALVTAFAIPFAYRGMRFVVQGGHAGGFAEMAELSLYFGMLVFSFLLRRRIAAESPRPKAA